MTPFKRKEILSAARLNELVRLASRGGGVKKKSNVGQRVVVAKILSSESVEKTSTDGDVEKHYVYKMKLVDKTKAGYSLDYKGWTELLNEESVKGFNFYEENESSTAIENGTIVTCIAVEVSIDPAPPAEGQSGDDPETSAGTEFELWFYKFPTTGIPFVVALVKDGGNNGSDAVDCSITYKCFYINDDTDEAEPIATLVVPLPTRLARITYTEGTFGLAVYTLSDAVGAIPEFKLMQVFDENITSGAC